MLHSFGVADIIYPLTALFWIAILYAVLVGARGLRDAGAALKRIAVEMERRNLR